jgi:pimeloyl-ACP methyl ester carboxylesterase
MANVSLRTVGLMVVAALLCHAPAATAQDAKPGVIFLVEGVGGANLLTLGSEIACRRAGLPHAVRRFRWSHGFGRVFEDLQDIAHVIAKGEELAGEIRAVRAKDPDARVFLVAHSGGTGVAVRAAESLPPDAVERMVLLSSALSPTYDLSHALAACREGIVSYHSSRDFLILGWGTRQFGTIDRKFVSSAGRDGFTLPEGVSADAKGLYSRLTQIPWDPRMILDGNWGNHNATIFPRFLSRDVARWLR